MNRKALKEKSKDQLREQWGTAAITTLVYTLLLTAITVVPVVGSIIATIVGPVFGFGLLYYFLLIARDQKPSVSDIFAGFSNFIPIIIASILISLFTFLWSLLFIIPGIIAGYKYCFTLYALADDPDLSALQAIRRSKELTNGYKFDIFVLQFSFFGWMFLSAITCGVAALWAIPYMSVAMANYYEAAKEAKDPDYVDVDYEDVEQVEA